MADGSTDLSGNDCDRSGLPAWSYFSKEMLEEEKEHLFRRHWQLICHVNDIPEPGDYTAMDMVGERALVVRGHDGRLIDITRAAMTEGRHMSAYGQRRPRA
mgnify:CR=1 FL=1